MLKVTRRHRPPCKRPMWDTGYTRCNCHITIRGTLNGKRITVAASKFLPPDQARDIDAASALARTWEKTGQVVLTVTPAPAPALDEVKARQELRTPLWRVLSLWLRSCQTRELKPSTLQKYRTFMGQLYGYATDRGYLYLDQFRPEDLDQFYAEWKDGKSSKAKKLERMKGFFQWAVRRKYITENPAIDLEPPAGHSVPNQKTPFTDKQLDRIFLAARNWPDTPWHNGAVRGMITHREVEGFVELLTETGFAITDAATFHMSRLDPETGECTIRRTKSGKPVNTWFPPEMVARLQELALRHGPQPFLTQSRDPLQAGDAWRERLSKIFAAAGPFPFKATPHIFRHTFVRIHLQNKKTSVKLVAELTGDTEAVILKHYAQWVPERQQELIETLKESYYRRRQERVGRMVLQMPSR